MKSSTIHPNVLFADIFLIYYSLYYLGPSLMPESLVRVQRLTGKSVIFYEADLCDKDSLRSVFAKVRIIFS